MSEAYSNFLAALDEKSDETKRTYEESFKYYLRFNETNNPQTLVALQPQDIQYKIRDFLHSLKASKLSYSSINKAYWAVRMFYACNQINLDWYWINLYKPKKQEKETEDRPYTKDEVTTILSEADERTKTAIFIMATGGCRVGALPGIRIKDLEFVERHELYCLTVYPFDQDARYRTFITPQASQFIDEYKGKRKDKEFLFINKRDPDLPITKGAIEQDVWYLLKRIGKPQNVQLDHGFRKFATTTWAQCGLDRELRELLDGQNPGVQKRYAKLPTLELLETSKYPAAIPTLTF